MLVEIRIFTLNGDPAPVLGTLLDLGFSPLVDSVHHRIEFDGVDGEVFLDGRLMISLPRGSSFSVLEWAWVGYWVKHHFEGGEMTEDVKYADTLLERGIYPSPGPSSVSEEGSEVLEEDYSLRWKKVGEGAVYEVKKPFTDRPYTVLLRSFNGDHTDFFSGLYASLSWGVAGTDQTFLQYCWSMLQMEGKFDLDKLVKERVERCENGEKEPELYRATLEFVEGLVLEGGSCSHFTE